MFTVINEAVATTPTDLGQKHPRNIWMLFARDHVIIEHSPEKEVRAGQVLQGQAAIFGIKASVERMNAAKP